MFRKIYRSPSIVTRHERELVHRLIRCQRSARDKRVVKVRHAGWKWSHAQRRAVLALTPYHGGGQRWAIPYRIVACESGGSWGAYNPSGALGPYQLLNKGAPFPVRSAAARFTHHRIAANLWRGGAGASHWVCK